MPGRAQLEDRDDDLDRDDERRDLGEGDHLRPDVDALAGRVLRAGERHVAEPARVGPGVEQQRDVEQQRRR